MPCRPIIAAVLPSSSAATAPAPCPVPPPAAKPRLSPSAHHRPSKLNYSSRYVYRARRAGGAGNPCMHTYVHRYHPAAPRAPSSPPRPRSATHPTTGTYSCPPPATSNSAKKKSKKKKSKPPEPWWDFARPALCPDGPSSTHPTTQGMAAARPTSHHATSCPHLPSRTSPGASSTPAGRRLIA